MVLKQKNMKKINTPIQLFKVHMNPNAKIEVGKILDSGYIGQGTKVDEFEVKLNEYFNSDRVVTLNSGTSGLHLALHLLKKSSKSILRVFSSMSTHLIFNPFARIGQLDAVHVNAVASISSPL